MANEATLSVAAACPCKQPPFLVILPLGLREHRRMGSEGKPYFLGTDAPLSHLPVRRSARTRRSLGPSIHSGRILIVETQLHQD
ncbi:hypothetical protein J6590_071143 [Homalodisca vitripennis]|nr:hypothetical protein J6590_071143 [Homalodisca vitripennis]